MGGFEQGSVTVDGGCLFLCQNEGILRRFRRVENQAGERVGVADAPLPDSHRTATPTVSRFVGVLREKIIRGQYLAQGDSVGVVK